MATGEKDLHAAIANAVGFLEPSREPHALLWLQLMHRRFGIAEFAGALDRYDRLLAERPKERAPLPNPADIRFAPSRPCPGVRF